MTEFLAQFSTPDVEAGLFKNIVTVVGWLVAIGLFLWQKLGKQTPQQIAQPLQVQAKVEFLPLNDFKEFKNETRLREQELKNSIDARFDTLHDERRESNENLHKHISSTHAKLTDTLQRVEDKIDKRLEDGAERMIQHDKAISALEATVKLKGGRA